MNEIINWLQGKKTYFVAAALGIVVALQAAGIIFQPTADALFGLLGATGVATVAAKFNRKPAP